MADAKTFGELLDSTELDEEPAAPEQEAPGPEAIEAAPEGDAKPERPRDEHGKFVKKGEEGAPPAPAEKQEFDGAATIAERRKRQEAEAEVERLRAQIQQQQQPQQEQQPPPDMFENPEGWQQHLTTQFQQALYQQSFAMSDRFARQSHGDETVNAALEWGRARCAQDGYFNQKVANSGDPVGYAVREYQRAQIVENVTPEDYAQFQAWREAQAAPAQQPQPPKPPPSLAGERSLAPRAGTVNTGPSTFGEILGN